VTANGLAVTNAHVVEGCRQVVDDQGRRMRVVAANQRSDLALIDAGRSFPAVVRFRARSAVDLGETVLVFGFPYGQALGTGLNVTNGIVTGLAGPGGDASRFQMNAAVQPGNSGGPAVDDAGLLLGVAVGRLNDIAVLRATGSLPQGINFAIRAAEVERFLDAQGVQPARGAAGGTGARAVSAAVAPAVFQILCRG
jgi:S1-C subfamily serine protease